MKSLVPLLLFYYLLYSLSFLSIVSKLILKRVFLLILHGRIILKRVLRKSSASLAVSMGVIYNYTLLTMTIIVFTQMS